MQLIRMIRDAIVAYGGKILYLFVVRGDAWIPQTSVVGLSIDISAQYIAQIQPLCL